MVGCDNYDLLPKRQGGIEPVISTLPVIPEDYHKQQEVGATSVPAAGTTAADQTQDHCGRDRYPAPQRSYQYQ